MSGMWSKFEYWHLYTLKHALQHYMRRTQKLNPKNDEIREQNLLRLIEEEIERFEERNHICKPNKEPIGGRE